MAKTFGQRVVGAALFDASAYEEVEADPSSMRQAIAVVLLASVADAIGMSRLGVLDFRSLLAGIVGAVAGWITWATLTYMIGTQLLPDKQTRADVGQLLRTLAFATTPGMLRALAVIPVVGLSIYVFATLWMLAAMIVAVRQALDYATTGRAVAVCLAGWMMSLLVVAIIGLLFAPPVF